MKTERMFRRGWALSALHDSFAFQDLPAEDRLRMREAVEAVLDNESPHVREDAAEMIRILDWIEQQE